MKIVNRQELRTAYTRMRPLRCSMATMSQDTFPAIALPGGDG